MIRTKALQWATAFTLGVAAAIPASHAEEPVQGGSVVYQSSKIPSLNPLHSAYEVGLVTSQLFASLVRLDENNEIAPYLAESWEISEDGLTYTFNLRDDVFFHDNPCFEGGKGRRMIAEDVKYSFNRIIDAKI